MRWLVAADGIFVAFWQRRHRRSRKGGGAEAEAAGEKPGIDWREVKVGVIALLDEAGKVVRGSQWYLVMWATAEPFRRQLWKVAEARGIRRIDLVVVISDGAKWLRALATRYFDWGIAIRDFFHAVEHLGAMGEALYGEGSAAVRWQFEMARRLKREGAAPLVEQWEHLQRRPKNAKVWQRELNYFRSQQDAMRYGEFREQTLPIGSGAAEGGCKNVVGMRFKLPGARWSEEGFQNMVPLRMRYCNGVSMKP